MRADLLLVQRGLASSRSQAQRLIASGVQCQRGGAWHPVTKSGDDLPVDAPLRLLDASEARYVSRGGLKLEAALRHTGLQPQGWTCLDVGQSTGGFTDCLLQHGAASVAGIDVGQGQLHPRLQADPRVRAFEGVNARDVDALAAVLAAVHPPQGFDLLVGDVSFISLTLVLPALVPWLRPGGHLLMLVKPQFELQPGQVGKGGIVRDASLYREVEIRLRAACASLGLVVCDWLPSPIAGGDGNREFFIHAVRNKAQPS